MVATLFREVQVHQAVELGDLQIDPQGRVWRVAIRRQDRWSDRLLVIPCDRRRAESLTAKYFQVRVMAHGKRWHALAHRLVWLHFRGPIPEGLTVNHMNGIWTDNRPENLELATPSEQVRHARQVLLRGRLNQHGTRNPMAKLTSEEVAEIRARRAAGEPLLTLANQFGVRFQHISRIARGDRRSLG